MTNVALSLPLALALCAATALPTLAQDAGPVTTVIRHPVADYSVWKVEYDKLLPLREAAGLIDAQVLHAPGDPNMVILIHRFETLDGAQALFASSEVKDGMANAGVLAKPEITIGLPAE